MIRCRGAAQLILFSSLCATMAAAPADAATVLQTIQQIAQTHAGSAVTNGAAVGISVGVIYPGQSSQFYNFGTANLATGAAFSANTLFEIASNTKVFTTNLLGQEVYAGTLKLSAPLSQFSTQLGGATERSLTGMVTLQELADFTSGLPDYAPLCTTQSIPGCMPNARPTLAQYTAGDFIHFFRDTAPRNYNEDTEPLLTSLPGPYLYSDFSLGLLGLILATPTGQISDASVQAWYDDLQSDILTPLGLFHTYLTVPAASASLVAAGYSPAEATATVANGAVTGITVTYAGGAYAKAPKVTLTGGGGTGATAVATLSGKTVASIAVQDGGKDYIAPPAFTFRNGGASETAKLSAIVSNGQITGVNIISPGKGYTAVPNVTVSGGRSTSGSDATLTAHIANGQVTFITVDSGGSGYVQPLTLKVAPGAAESQVVPIWAPSGSLIASSTDMVHFAEAALGRDNANGRSVPTAITEGFKIAETAYACATSTPALSTCPAAASRSGLAWEIIPADATNGGPEIITKNGGLPGFTSQIVLVPGSDMAVVVLMNSDATGMVRTISFDIAYGIYYGLLK